MKRKIFVFILTCIILIMTVACGKDGKSENYTSAIVKDDTETAQNTKAQTTEAHEPETGTSEETEIRYELNTVEALEDDGKEMSVAEAIKSTMKGKHSALELMYDERLFHLAENERIDGGWNEVTEIKDMPDAGLARINMNTYNRKLDKSIVPINKAEWDSFVCIDLDNDGKKEVLVKGGPGGVALHYAGGEVYMTVINTRSFPIDIYENGVYSRDGGGVFGEIYSRLYPTKGAMYDIMVAHKYDDEGLTTNPPIYKIMEKDVAKEEYDAYVEELIGGLTPLEWHEFTEENIDRYVVD